MTQGPLLVGLRPRTARNTSWKLLTLLLLKWTIVRSCLKKSAGDTTELLLLRRGGQESDPFLGWGCGLSHLTETVPARFRIFEETSTHDTGCREL